MTDVFVIRNQQGHYWGKSKQWLDGSDNRAVLRTKHEDEAVNTLFELSAKDIDLRGEVVAAELDQRNNPIIEPSEVPLPVEPGVEADSEAGAEAVTRTEAETEAEAESALPSPAEDDTDGGGVEPDPAAVVENGQPESKEVS